MSRDARIALDWADGTHEFRLGIGQWRELQEKCDAGPFAILQRLMAGQWLVNDIVEIHRLGLIGAGAKPVDALRLTRLYVEERPLLENLDTARLIVQAGLMGAPDEKLGESEAASETDGSLTHSPTERSASPPSTEPAP